MTKKKSAKTRRLSPEKALRTMARLIHEGGVTGAVPPPGIDGTSRGSCFVCLRGTDTALRLRGDAEWIVAGLVALGVPGRELPQIMSSTYGTPRGRVCLVAS